MKRATIVAALVASILLMAGCDAVLRGTISQEQFQQIELQMTEDEVREIAGEPYASNKYREGSPTRSRTETEWRYNGRDVILMFRNGKLFFKHHDEWGYAP
jgi:uncharacterized protein YceK